MNDASHSTRPRLATPAVSAKTVLLTLLLAVGTAASVLAQGELGSGTVSGSGSGPYSYSLSFSDLGTATSPIGSIWYAWVPGQFYLPSVPTGASAPSGWTAAISSKSIQFTANSSANYIQPGATLSGFSYTATFSPATLATTPNSGTSVAYSAGLFSDGGNTFTVSIVPEPSTLALLVGGVAAWGLARRRNPRAS
jgi:hypothetical protein